MKNKNKNIAKFFSGKLPDPEIPADDAWEKMNDMLHTPTPGNKLGQTFKAVSGSTLKLLAGLTLAGLTVIGVVLFSNTDVKNDFIKHKKTVNRPLPNATTKENVIAPELNKKQSLDANVPGSKDLTESGNIEKHESTNEASDVIKKSESVELEVTAKPEHIANSKYIAEPKDIKKPNKAVVSAGAVHTKPARSITNARKLNNPSRKNVQNEKLASDRQKNVTGERSEHISIGNENTVSSGTDYNKRYDQVTLLKLKSLPVTIRKFDPNLAKRIKSKPNSNASTAKSAATPPKENAFEIGLEWNLNAPLKRTDFLFNSIDSVKKPATLLIPGIWVTKSFREKHFLTLSMCLNQPYFGNSNTLAQVTDTIPGIDSAHWYRNTNLVKTIAFNTALQYQYQFVNHFMIGAGVAYSRTSGALVHTQTFNRSDNLLGAEYVTLKGRRQTDPYLNANIFYFKAGVSYKVGRFQAGINILAPISNLAASPQYDIRRVNGQFFLRFRVWQRKL